MLKSYAIGFASLAMAVSLAAAPAKADTILFVSDGSGNIGQVDVTTKSVVAGTVHNTGQFLTDIGFNSTGTLYGTTFTNLYSINTTTGAATSLGAYGNEGAMNALVGSGGTTLLGASFSNGNIYTISPAAPANPTVMKVVSANSAGDLAFAGSTLYESAVAPGGVDELLNVTTNTVVGVFHVGSTAGATLSSVFGLADDGTTLYGVSGTEVYSVNLTNAVLTPLFDYSTAENGQTLTGATGTAFLGEGPTTSTPEPASLILLGTGIAASALIRRSRNPASKA